MTGNTKPLAKRTRGRPRQRAKALNHSTIALFVLDLVRGYGITLDEATIRASEWFRARGARRISPSLCRKVYSRYFGPAGRTRNRRHVEEVGRRFAVAHQRHSDAELLAILDRAAPLPRDHRIKVN